ncbi:beta-galactoside-binding lectin isoform X2 [Kryptolebias marmoratus]|uniref:Galectin n=1 Tax=Kryptolebias marmoratus TaxID=37003 RepID=A0A3Q2ZBL5_KRYMA|nr:beta-galactoside-binding lectin isoform X1 [Kryptolebias marmoratus]XP_037834595.1 beta-galactoside-binding lectin isoform X2 [Kryptolebias marmoratus]
MEKGMEIKNMSFKVGQTLTVVGIPNPDALCFCMDIGLDKDNLTLHINPRFNSKGDEKVVVCNSYQGGKWAEEIREGCFPFRHGEEFIVTVKFLPTGFSVIFCSESAINFPNRLGAKKYSFFSFSGGIRIISVEVK